MCVCHSMSCVLVCSILEAALWEPWKSILYNGESRKPKVEADEADLWKVETNHKTITACKVKKKKRKKFPHSFSIFML